MREPAGSDDLLDLVTPVPAPEELRLSGPWFEVTGAALRTVLRMGRDTDGRPACLGVLIGWNGTSTPITARAIHALPLAHLVEAVVSVIESDGEASALMLATPKAIRRRVYTGRPQLPDSHYVAVAAAYIEAKQIAPRSPVRFLSRKFDVSRATIHRWLTGARIKGLFD